MPLENVTIRRICLHEVYKRPDTGPALKPNYGLGLLNLKADAAAAFRSRIIAAFKTSAQSMDMIIRDYGKDTAIEKGITLLSSSDSDFVSQSSWFADSLANAQTSRQIPGGLMAVFDGTLGNPATPFLGLMKAELHEGFLKTPTLQATFVSDLFLSPKTKLYKIGLFISDDVMPRPTPPGGWRSIVYDSAMTATQRDNAANYFYETFLGLQIPTNSAQLVRKFFTETKAFIQSTKLSDNEKIDLHNSLYAYLKLDQGSTIQASGYANSFLKPDLAGAYLKHMDSVKFPTTAVSKDLSEISASLRIRKLRFKRSITLTGPPDAVRDLVKVTKVTGDGGQKWTQLVIQSELESQE